MEKVFAYKNGNIKVMYNESGMLRDYEEEYIVRDVDRETCAFAKEYSVSVEWSRHVGGKICYGMLGATVRPYHKADSVRVSMAYTQKNTVKYDESLLLNDEYVYKGLPIEYVGYLEECIEQYIKEKDAFPQCEIVLNQAANCEVGSSEMFFSYIAQMLINMIYNDSVEEIIDMDVEEFTSRYVEKI